MEKIENFSLVTLVNDLHLQLMNDFVADVNKAGAGELAIANVFGQFPAILLVESTAMRTETGNALSKILIDLDNLRESTRTGIYKRVDSTLHSPVATEVASAVILKRIIDKYGKTLKKDYNAKSNMITLLVTDLLLTANAPHLQALGLTAWVAALKTQNEQFQTTYNKRDAENASRPSGNTKEARKAVDAMYLTLVDMINATIILNQAKPVAISFVKEWNEKLARYRTIIAQKKGRKGDGTENKESDK